MKSQWYYTRNGDRMGPVDSRDLRRLAAAGAISPGDFVWREGMAGWEKAAAIPGLLPSPGQAPVPRPASVPGQGLAPGGTRARPAELGNRARETFRLYRLFWSRICRSDFGLIRATPEEVRALEGAARPVRSALAQDYASWRRSLLMVCILVLGITLAFSANEIRFALLDTGRHPVMRLQSGVFFLFQVASFLLCLIAAFRWSCIPSSKAFALIAWLVQFAGPFLVLLLPLSLFVSNQMVLLSLGLISVKTLAPKVFGLFPGIIRCSLSLKTLLPESPVPGWLCMVVAPLYGLFLVLAAIAALQTSLVILGAGLLLIAVGTGVVLARSWKLLAPDTQESASIHVGKTRKIQALFQGAGIGLVAFQVLRQADFHWEWINSVMVFTFSFLGNVTLMTVVMSDFLLCMIHEGQRQSEAFSGTGFAADYRERLGQLADCGLTDLQAGELRNVASLGGRLTSLAKPAPGSHQSSEIPDARAKAAFSPN
jgi:hypothetical protein